MTVEKTKIPSKNADDADDFFFKWLANKSALVQSLFFQSWTHIMNRIYACAKFKLKLR